MHEPVIDQQVKYAPLNLVVLQDYVKFEKDLTKLVTYKILYIAAYVTSEAWLPFSEREPLSCFPFFLQSILVMYSH